MADYNSAYTGAQVDAAVAKSQGIPAAAAITEAVEPAAASAGDVWTADGQGGATWETPSGGGSQLYQHYIRMHGATEYYDFSFISSDAQFTSFDSFRSMLTAKNYTALSRGLPVKGVILNNDYVGSGTVLHNIQCFFRDSMGTRVSTYDFNGTTGATAGMSITSFTDVCTPL